MLLNKYVCDGALNNLEYMALANPESSAIYSV